MRASLPMKLPTVLLAGSLVANAALFAAFTARPSLAPSPVRTFFEPATSAKPSEPGATTAPATRAKRVTGPAVWSSLQSDDLKTLVQRLRAAGFPASVIRTIVNAEIAQRFSARLKEINTSAAAREYWKGSAFTSMNSALSEERNRLMRERSRLMRDVLGDDFFATDDEAASESLRARYGNISKAKIDVIQRVNDDYTEMSADVRSSMRGIVLPEDRAKLALLEREKRADLAAILTPEELADYEMRTSRVTMNMKSALTLMDATEQEFKTIYGIQQKYADQLYPNSDGASGVVYTAAMSKAREDAEASAQAEIIAALGAARGAEFIRSADYEYQSLSRMAKLQNLPSDAAARAYDLRSGAAAESVKIAEDKSLSADQKRTALQALAQSTKAQLVNTLGPTAGEQYAKSSGWLQAIERGSSVRFSGRSTSYISVSR